LPDETYGAPFELPRIELDLRLKFPAQSPGEVFDCTSEVMRAHPTVTKSSPKTGQG
jgi:hypothetical protein